MQSCRRPVVGLRNMRPKSSAVAQLPPRLSSFTELPAWTLVAEIGPVLETPALTKRPTVSRYAVPGVPPVVKLTVPPAMATTPEAVPEVMRSPRAVLALVLAVPMKLNPFPSAYKVVIDLEAQFPAPV